MLREYLPFWDRLTEGQRRRLEEGAAVRRLSGDGVRRRGGVRGAYPAHRGQLRAYMLTDEGRS